MSIASWLLPVLWREHDWRGALERLGTQLAGVEGNAQSHRAALELGRASEYIEPDRRRAIAAYELSAGSDLGRSRELATELGWWSARARLLLAARTADPNPQLALDEVEAWWDAGQPDLSALALAGLRGMQQDVRAQELAALLAEQDLQDHAADAVSRAMSSTGTDAADAYVMAARFSRAAGRMGDVTRWLESALAAQPQHAIAASFLLALARDQRDANLLQRLLRVRCDGADFATWIDVMRASALALIDSDYHRGFGLRLLRKALERAYEWPNAVIPGHLAMWTVLAAHASADGTRRDLLPLVITALQATRREVDRVWLGALATEISMRDAKNPVVAGAYAEIVAEFAPEHPVVRELVAAVATSTTAVPKAAVNAAASLPPEDSLDIEFDLDGAYADVLEASMTEELVEEIEQPPPRSTIAAFVKSREPKPTPNTHLRAPAAPPPVASKRTTIAATPIAKSVRAQSEPRPEPARPSSIAKAPEPITAATPTPGSTKSDAARPMPVAKPGARTTVEIPALPSPDAKPAKPSVAPASIAKPTSPAKLSSIIPASIANPASIVPASLTKRIPVVKPAAAATTTSALPVISRVPPTREVLAALRTPDRPSVPPRPADPPDATPRARRISIPIDVRLIHADGKRLDGHSRDISTSGLFVLTSASLDLGAQLTIELSLPGKEAFTEEAYRTRARVTRRDTDGYGLVLVEPDAALLAALAAL